MIAQILADPGQVVRDLYAERLQKGSRADSGKLQQLRRVDRTAAQDDFAAGPHLDGFAATPTLRIFDADRSLAFQEEACGMRIGMQCQFGRDLAGLRNARAVLILRPL